MACLHQERDAHQENAECPAIVEAQGLPVEEALRSSLWVYGLLLSHSRWWQKPETVVEAYYVLDCGPREPDWWPEYDRTCQGSTFSKLPHGQTASKGRDLRKGHRMR